MEMVYSFCKHLLGVLNWTWEAIKSVGNSDSWAPSYKVWEGRLESEQGKCQRPVSTLLWKKPAGGERGFPGVQWKTAEAWRTRRTPSSEYFKICYTGIATELNLHISSLHYVRDSQHWWSKGTQFRCHVGIHNVCGVYYFVLNFLLPQTETT